MQGEEKNTQEHRTKQNIPNVRKFFIFTRNTEPFLKPTFFNDGIVQALFL